MEQNQFCEKLSDCLAKDCGGRPRGTVLVAFSGGSDSVALLMGLHHLGMDIYAFHVNHLIRGGEARRDAAFCRQFCAKQNIPFFAVEIDVPILAEQSRTTLEEAGRAARYGAIRDFCLSHAEVCAVATAHHMDDQAETVLYRLFRGTSPRGMGGIAFTRPFSEENGHTVSLIRPLLCVTKQEIVDFCKMQAYDYVTDSTNEDKTYARNRIRQEILPATREISSRSVESMAQFAALARSENDYFDGIVANFTKSHVINGKIDRASLLQEHPAVIRRILAASYAAFAKEALQKRPKIQLQEKHLEDMVQAVRQAKKTMSLSLPQKVDFSVSDDTVYFRWAFDKIRYADTLLCEGYQTFDGGNVLVWLGKPQLVPDVIQNVYKMVISVRINSATLKNNLSLRNSRGGERIFCGGRARKIRELLRLGGVAASLRRDLPLICDGETILWVPGGRCADGYLAGKDTPQDQQLQILYAQGKADSVTTIDTFLEGD